ncbi:hypothetical protein TNCV_2945611 [Trichonephila clavipes]|nr:hypothetical protein TNCV_2945611 [Trichonephila clavipes]
MALRNKESALNKMSRCRTRNLAPVHSRRGRECDCEFRANRTLMRREELRGRGRPRDFCDLRMRRDEGRVVNTPLVFKRVLFQEREDGRRRKRREREGGDGKGERERRRRKRGRERGGDGKREERERSPPCMEKRAESGDWSGKSMNADGVENGI